MQCPNCQFNNMPGTATCARCGSSLTLASSDLDVHPPRAGSMALAFRRLVPFQHALYAFRDRASGISHCTLPALDARMPETALLIRLVVPGWAQLRLGQRRLGHFLLWAWLALMLSGLLYFGTSAGSILMGLAFSVHSFGAADLINRAATNRGFGAQLGRSILVSVVLALALYGPGAYLLTRIADPLTLGYTAGPFREGDSLLVNHWATPDRGSVVMYDVPRYQRPYQRGGPGRQIVGYSGQRIDRVVAVEGDRVEIRGGVLLVNGKLATHLPLGAARPGTIREFTLGEEMVFIVPSTTPDLTFATDPTLLMEMSIVPRGSIRGVVYARLHPLNRFRLIF